MARSNCVIYIYSDEKRDFVSLFDLSTNKQLQTNTPNPRDTNWRERVTMRTLPTFSSSLRVYSEKRHTRFGYGYSEEWLVFVESQIPNPEISKTAAEKGSNSTKAISQFGPFYAFQSRPFSSSKTGPQATQYVQATLT